MYLILTFIIILGIIGIGFHFFKLKALAERGVRTMATVVNYEESDGDDSTMYHPVIRFKDKKGVTHTKRMKLGSSWKLYDMHTELEIIYHPDNPDDWMLCKPPQPLVYIFIAVLLLLLAGFIFGE